MAFMASSSRVEGNRSVVDLMVLLHFAIINRVRIIGWRRGLPSTNRAADGIVRGRQLQLYHGLEVPRGIDSILGTALRG